MGGKLRSRVDFSGGIPYNITQVSPCRRLADFASPRRACRRAASAGRTPPRPRNPRGRKGAFPWNPSQPQNPPGPRTARPPGRRNISSPSSSPPPCWPSTAPCAPWAGEHHLPQRHRGRGLPGGPHPGAGPGRPHRGRRRPDRPGGPGRGLPGQDSPGGGGDLPGPPGQRHHRRPGLRGPGLPGGPRPALPPAGGRLPPLPAHRAGGPPRLRQQRRAGRRAGPGGGRPGEVPCGAGLEQGRRASTSPGASPAASWTGRPSASRCWRPSAATSWWTSPTRPSPSLPFPWRRPSPGS